MQIIAPNIYNLSQRSVSKLWVICLTGRSTREGRFPVDPDAITLYGLDTNTQKEVKPVSCLM